MRTASTRCRDLGHHDSTWFAPNAVAWWVGVLFMIGSACFALGALPGYLDLVGTTADNVTYFVGSLFFTSAGFLQYWEVVNAPTTLDGARPPPSSVRLGAAPHRLVGERDPVHRDRSTSTSAPASRS